MSSGGQWIWWRYCVTMYWCWLHISAQLARYRGLGKFELWLVHHRPRIWRLLSPSDILAFILFWSISVIIFYMTVDGWHLWRYYISWNQYHHHRNNHRRDQMVQLGPDGSMMSPLVFGGWEVKQESTNFGIISNTDPHDGLTVSCGPLFAAVPVSTDVTNVEHRN